ncbi:MAG TPA: iron-sulfur binding hydrogenase [Thermotogota bacterium]|nr:iron-sulfur binding hydrogenase [Thermotogota bacterium]
MLLEKIIENIDLEIISEDNQDKEIKTGYTSDLLSEVMSSGGSDLWITVQSHSNIVAVATIIGVKAIVLVNGRDYSQDTIEKAKEEGICLLKSKQNAFDITGKIYAMLQG